MLELFVLVQEILLCLFVQIVRACPFCTLFVGLLVWVIYVIVFYLFDCLLVCLDRLCLSRENFAYLYCFLFVSKIVPACPGITCLFVQIVGACPGREHWHSKLRFAGRGNKLDSAPASCQISSESRDLNFDLFTQDALKENKDVFQKYTIDC